MKFTPYTLAWGAIALATAVLESVALIDPGRGDTLSEHIWALDHALPILRIVGVGFVTWLGYHLFVDRRAGR